MRQRFAVALAIRDSAGRVTVGLRRDDEQEYRTRWSLPSFSVTEAEYTEIVGGAALPLTLFQGCRFDRLGVRPPINTMYLRSCDRYRSGYRLSLALLGGEAVGNEISSTKYQTLELLPVDQMLSRMHNEVGSCVSLLLEELYEAGVGDYTQLAIELSPELADADRDIRSYSQDELWNLCAANYNALKTGRSGGDGHLKRRFALEPALARFVQSLPTGCRVADLGCGDGQLVQKLREAGHYATGIDIGPSAPSDAGGENVVRSGRIEHLENYYEPQSVDVAVLALVCQWLSDMSSVLAGLAHALVPWGRAVVILVAPEFAKSGDWDFSSSPPHFVLNQPFRRKPFLTMINRGVGPLWHHSRSIPEYLSLFGTAGFACVRAEYLYLDTFASEAAVAELFSTRPYLMQNIMVPCFLWLEFAKIPEH